MNRPPSAASAPPEDEAAPRADAALHRRGSDIESGAGPSAGHDDEEHLPTDDAPEAEQEPSSQSVDETDVLSMGGPDSLEDVEGGDDLED